jgi:predicted PurR-regulated permease PerM
LDEATKSAKAHRRRRLFFAIWGGFVLGTLILFRGVLLPFFLAIIVAYVLTPVVSAMERVAVRGRRLPRWLAVVLVYTGLLGVLALMLTIGAPRLGAEVQKLARDLPAAVTEARNEWVPQLEATVRRSMAAYDRDEPPPAAREAAADGQEAPHVEGIRIVPVASGAEGYEVYLPPGGLVVTPDGDRYAITHGAEAEPVQRDIAATIMDSIRGLTKNTEHRAAAVIQTAQTLVRAVVKGVFTFFIMLMLSAYLIITREGMISFLRSLVWPEETASFDRLLARIDQGLSGVVRGQLFICLVNGVLSGIGFYLFDLRYWPILTLVATLLSIIPIFGAILSSIPAVVIGLQQGGFGTAVAVLAWILVVHQIEANLLNPKIMGDAAHVHPVLVVFALLAGEHLFGIAGALLAVPVLSIAQSLFLHYREVVFGVGPAAGVVTDERSSAAEPPKATGSAGRATA